jgi:hypothetical protein
MLHPLPTTTLLAVKMDEHCVEERTCSRAGLYTKEGGVNTPEVLFDHLPRLEVRPEKLIKKPNPGKQHYGLYCTWATLLAMM